jgi:hypothetical protein
MSNPLGNGQARKSHYLPRLPSLASWQRQLRVIMELVTIYLRAFTSEYFPPGVKVPQHFLEYSALTGKSANSTPDFADLIPVKVKQNFYVLELLCT